LKKFSLQDWAAITLLGLSLSIIGFTLNTMDYYFLGLALMALSVSGVITPYVKSDHPARKALEVFLALGAVGTVFLWIPLDGKSFVGTVFYEYLSTGSLLLAALTVFIVVLMLVGFTLSYILPKIRG